MMADEPDLSPGISSEWVLYLQQLINRHYQASVVAESGSFDEATESAVRHLREQNGLPDGSQVDDPVWAVLTGREPPVASSSSSGAAEPAADPHQELWPEASSVKFWLKVFIPGTYHGNVDGVGAAAGRRLLPGPSSWVNDCFASDDRGFSDDIAAPSRMHSEFRMELPSTDLTEVHWCGETVEFDCEDGEEECRATADTGRMHWTDKRRVGDVIHVDVAGAANNPCFGGSPDIDYVGTVSVDLAHRTVSFEGRVNRFPAYEAYATVNDGAGTMVFQEGPTGDPLDLAGDADHAVSGTASF